MSALEKLFEKYKNIPLKGMTEEEKEYWINAFNNTKDVLQVSEKDYDLFLKSYIPKGAYCYDENGVCPFWNRENSEVVYCRYLDLYDYSESPDSYLDDLNEEEIDRSSFILWDQCKECGECLEN